MKRIEILKRTPFLVISVSLEMIKISLKILLIRKRAKEDYSNCNK